MTRASQTFDNKRWVEVDTFAGEIIGGTKNSFERMLGRANNLSTESVDAAFGLAV
jgi:flavin-binding protein dodecin